MSFYDRYQKDFEEESGNEQIDIVATESDAPIEPYDNVGLLGSKIFKEFDAKGRRKPVELLAPATASSYKHVIYNGATAIYFGYKEFNARAGGDNIDIPEKLKEVVNFCHLFNVKAYLALNIVFKTKELNEVKDIIIEAESANIDAFIIADLTLLPIIKRYSSAEIHASTQLGTHNRLGAEYLWNLGFDRAVLSRECTFDEISDIRKKSHISTEVFCHGALCIGFSGACLLSSMLTGNSGNRGRCNQLCRMEYSNISGGKTQNKGYLLSAKEISTVNILSEITSKNVDSLKIEGRMRKADYAAGVSAIYSKVLFNKHSVNSNDTAALSKLFNRGFTAGYLYGNDVIYPDAPGHIGFLCGKIAQVSDKNTAYVFADFAFNKSDGFKIFRKNSEVCGAVATGIARDGKYEINLFDIKEQPQSGDLVRITSDINLRTELLSKRKKIEVSLIITVLENEEIHIIAQTGNLAIDIWDNPPENATGKGIDKATVISQFSKTNDTDFDFIFEEVEVGNVFLTKSKLNELRRRTVAEIEKLILGNYTRNIGRGVRLDFPPLEKIEGDFAEFSSISQLPDKLYVKNAVFSPAEFEEVAAKEFYQEVKLKCEKVFIKLPIFLPAKAIPLAEKLILIFDGVIANNFYALQLAKRAGKLAVGGINLNIMSNKNPLINGLNQYTASIELTNAELRPHEGALVYAYGNLPLMYLNHCPKILSGNSCKNCTNDVIYADKKGFYPIKTQKITGYCQHVLKNGVTTNLVNALPNHYKYLDFSDNTKTEIERILRIFYENDENLPLSFNKLHLSRGVK